ncbi:uncharacterized protein KY384_005793 [Bacidia gigantensis]|uniref:uncharacterized protein n=1 Tax=Bacidia gigantensis TaxID=2732470 RepID=UPI001D0486BE|nr:uncharacterized protein KY384_005793 [Bacidia gigantensis]KAG8529158.1 hypothetical protein KY384_005793 [Bacidia gigantensis]
MAAPFAKGISTATKRARSQDSIRKSETPPVAKASKVDEPPEPTIPAFLRQSKIDINAKFSELNWQEKLRIMQGRNDPDSPWTQDSHISVLQRNRYTGVQPWDKSRIRLKVGQGMLDYINASPIALKDPGTGLETRFIATQTQEIAVIVMLTPTEEQGREKCFQYFPLDAEASPFQIKANGHPDSPEEGRVSFVELQQQQGEHTQIRKLHLTFGDETKVVWHLLFTAFPDFGVPEDEDRVELLDLIKISSRMNSHPQNPRTIHCSAGVGRSGTFIALEYLLAQVESGAIAKVDAEEDIIFDLVHQLREQRMLMVQSEMQYQFLYDVVAEEWAKKIFASQMSEQPSPKLMKLNDGIRIAVLDEIDVLQAPGTPNIEIHDTADGQTEQASSEDTFKPTMPASEPELQWSGANDNTPEVAKSESNNTGEG